MNKIRAKSISVPANTNDHLIGTITTPDGHQYNYVEIGLTMPTGTGIKVFQEDELLIDTTAVVDTDIQRRVISWPAPKGIEMRIYGDNTTGGALVVGCELNYDDVPA